MTILQEINDAIDQHPDQARRLARALNDHNEEIPQIKELLRQLVRGQEQQGQQIADIQRTLAKHSAVLAEHSAVLTKHSQALESILETQRVIRDDQSDMKGLLAPDDHVRNVPFHRLGFR